jgi:hypothetical protein
MLRTSISASGGRRMTTATSIRCPCCRLARRHRRLRRRRLPHRPRVREAPTLNRLRRSLPWGRPRFLPRRRIRRSRTPRSRTLRNPCRSTPASGRPARSPGNDRRSGLRFTSRRRGLHAVSSPDRPLRRHLVVGTRGTVDRRPTSGGPALTVHCRSIRPSARGTRRCGTSAAPAGRTRRDSGARCLPPLPLRFRARRAAAPSSLRFSPVLRP